MFDIKQILLQSIFALGSFTNSIAQTHEWISSDFPGSLVIDVIDANSTIYVAVSNGEVNSNNPELDYRLSIYEIQFINTDEPDFVLHKIRDLSFPDYYGTYSIYYVEETNRWLITQSTKLFNNESSIRTLLLDENFNIIDSTAIDTFGNPLKCHVDTHDSKTYIIGSIFGPPENQIYYLYYDHATPNTLPKPIIRPSYPNSIFWITSMKFDPYTENFLLFYYKGITEINPDLEQISTYNYNEIHTSNHGLVVVSNKNYYSNGCTYQSEFGGLRNVVVQKFDSLFNSIYADTFGVSNSDNYPFIGKSIDLKGDFFVVGGHLQGPLTSDFNKDIKKFYVAKYSTNMEKLWYKEFGGDRCYVLQGLKLLENGSCLVYGFVTDTVTYIRHAYILFLNKYGDVVVSQEFPNKDFFNIKIVNPGSEELIIFNNNNCLYELSLYTMDGRKLGNYTIETGENKFSALDIPKGIYVFNVVANRKIILTGKWSKL